MSATSIAIPPLLTAIIGHLAAAVPARTRTTFTELLVGAATTRGGHVTDAILAAGLTRSWTTYYWFLEYGRWAWLAVWRALPGILTALFAPAVWYVVIDDTVVERISTRAPGSLIHHNHTAKPNRPGFLRGQGWRCLAAVVERDWRVGAVPLMLRLVRRGANRGKLKRALSVALAGQPARPGPRPARRLVHARPADPGHGGRGPHRDRPGAPRPRALYRAQAAPPHTWATAQIRRALHPWPDRGAAAPAQRPNPVRQSRGRALPHGPGVGPLPERPGGAGRVGAART